MNSPRYAQLLPPKVSVDDGREPDAEGFVREYVLRRQKEDLWRAVLEAAETLGLPDILPRVVASKLPVDWWPHIARKLGAGGGDLEVPHRCPLQEPHEPQECLTAILVELAVHWRQAGANGMERLLVTDLRIDAGKAFLKLRPSLLGLVSHWLVGSPRGSLKIPMFMDPAVHRIIGEYPSDIRGLRGAFIPNRASLGVFGEEM